MTVASILVSATTLVAGVFFMINPENNLSYYGGEGLAAAAQGGGPHALLSALLRWLSSGSAVSSLGAHESTQQRAALPPAGRRTAAPPDVRIRLGHAALRGNGFHRRLSLHAELVKDNAAASVAECSLSALWSLPKDVFVDYWRASHVAPLGGAGGITWRLDGEVNVEAAAYAKEATAFQLRATIPLADGVAAYHVEIPQMTMRYQAEAARVAISPPSVSVACEPRGDAGRPVRIRLERIPAQYGPLDMTVPFARPSAAINNGTLLAVFFSLLYLLGVLYKS